METMIVKVLSGVVVYLLVGVLYFFVHDFGVDFYKEHMGGFTDRGAAIGGTAELTFYFFIFMNFIVFFMPRLSLKILFIVLMSGVVLFYFLPDNPVRAIAYAGLTVCMSILALVARLMVDRWFARYVH